MGGEVIWINEAKDSPKKTLRKQINGKFNNVGSADENNLKKYIYIYHYRAFI
jgi:hypothetical protein